MAPRSRFNWLAEIEYCLGFLIALRTKSKYSIDRVGCFKYSPVEGAAANALPDPVPPEVKEARYDAFMTLAASLSEEKLRQRIGRTIEVLVDEVDEEGAIARSQWDAPEIDGTVYIDVAGEIAPGDKVMVEVTDADTYDLYGAVIR